MTIDTQELEAFERRVDEVRDRVYGMFEDRYTADEVDFMENKVKKVAAFKKKEQLEKCLQREKQGVPGGGTGEYDWLCKFCFLQFTQKQYELNEGNCSFCQQPDHMVDRSQRTAELNQKVEEYKKDRAFHIFRKDRFERFSKSRKILRNVGMDYVKWHYWEDATDTEEEKEREEKKPISTPDTPEFKAFESSLSQRSKKLKGAKRAAISCKKAGNRLFLQQDYYGALQEYDQGLEHCRRVMALWLNKGLTEMKLFRYTEGITSLTRLLEYNDLFEDGLQNGSPRTNLKALVARAHGLNEVHRFEEAYDDLEKALTLGKWMPSGLYVELEDRKARIAKCMNAKGFSYQGDTHFRDMELSEFEAFLLRISQRPDYSLIIVAANSLKVEQSPITTRRCLAVLGVLLKMDPLSYYKGFIRTSSGYESRGSRDFEDLPELALLEVKNHLSSLVVLFMAYDTGCQFEILRILLATAGYLSQIQKVVRKFPRFYKFLVGQALLSTCFSELCRSLLTLLFNDPHSERIEMIDTAMDLFPDFFSRAVTFLSKDTLVAETLLTLFLPAVQKTNHTILGTLLAQAGQQLLHFIIAMSNRSVFYPVINIWSHIFRTDSSKCVDFFRALDDLPKFTEKLVSLLDNPDCEEPASFILSRVVRNFPDTSFKELLVKVVENVEVWSRMKNNRLILFISALEHPCGVRLSNLVDIQRAVMDLLKLKAPKDYFDRHPLDPEASRFLGNLVLCFTNFGKFEQAGLTSLDMTSVIEPLVETLRKSDRAVQRNTVSALVQIGLMERYRPEMRRLQAFESLHQIGKP